MEFCLSGNALRTFGRSITCVARIGNELAMQASPSQLTLHTINSSRSAYQSITFKSSFFDMYTISGTQVQCSLLLKAICSVLRTPIQTINQLNVRLPDPDSSKVQWTLECHSGNVELRKWRLMMFIANATAKLQAIARGKTSLICCGITSWLYGLKS